MNYKINNNQQIRGFSLIEMICVVGLFSLIASITAPLFCDIITNIPRMNTMAQERNCFTGILDRLRDDIEAAKTVSLDQGVMTLVCPDDSFLTLNFQDEKLSYTRVIGEDTKVISEIDFGRTVVEVLPFPPDTDTPSAINLRISDIAKRQPVLKLKQTFNVLIYLKEGQYATQK